MAVFIAGFAAFGCRIVIFAMYSVFQICHHGFADDLTVFIAIGCIYFSAKHCAVRK